MHLLNLGVVFVDHVNVLIEFVLAYLVLLAHNALLEQERLLRLLLQFSQKLLFVCSLRLLLSPLVPLVNDELPNWQHQRAETLHAIQYLLRGVSGLLVLVAAELKRVDFSIRKERLVDKISQRQKGSASNHIQESFLQIYSV